MTTNMISRTTYNGNERSDWAPRYYKKVLLETDNSRQIVLCLQKNGNRKQPKMIMLYRKNSDALWNAENLHPFSTLLFMTLFRLKGTNLLQAS